MKKNLLLITALLTSNSGFCMEKPESGLSKPATLMAEKSSNTQEEDDALEVLKLQLAFAGKKKAKKKLKSNQEVVLDNKEKEKAINSLPLAIPAPKESEIKEPTKATKLQKALAGKKEKTKKETKKSKSATKEIAKQKTPSLASAEEQKIALDLKNNFIRSSKVIARIATKIDDKQKSSLEKLKICQQRIEELKKEIPATATNPESLIKYKLKWHLASAESIEIKYKLMLIDSIIEKCFQQKEKIIKQIELLEPDRDVKLILECLKKDISHKDLCKKIGKLLKNKSDTNEEVNLAINNIAKKLEFTLSKDELLLLDDAKINPNSFAKYLATNREKQIETFTPIKDEKNDQIIYLHKHNIESDKTLNKLWFQTIQDNVLLWFKNPNAALEQGGYNDPAHKNYHRKKNAIPCHTFHKDVDPIAKQHSILMKQIGKLDKTTGKKENDCILALMPGHIVQNGQVTYGNFEFAFGDSKKCHHRFFSPLIIIKKKGELPKDGVTDSETILPANPIMSESNPTTAGKVLDLSHVKINKMKDFALTSAMQKKQTIKIDRKKQGQILGKYFYSNNALVRMLERKMTPQQIQMIIDYDDHYTTYSGARLCVDLRTKCAVLIHSKTNTVLSVFRGIDQQKLNDWIARRDIAIKAKQDKKKLNKFEKVSIDPEFDDEYSSDEEYRDLEEKLTKKSKKEKR